MTDFPITKRRRLSPGRCCGLLDRARIGGRNDASSASPATLRSHYQTGVLPERAGQKKATTGNTWEGPLRQ